MKRCPTCNQTFEEDWLSFCTTDGTQLVDASSLGEPPPTIRVSAVDTNPAGRPTFDLPGSYTPPPPVRYAQPPMAPAWQPPPAPLAYTTQPQQGLALTSMILGLVSITVGWCCYFGVITSPISIIMGAIALNQIKTDPAKYGGKPLAIIGVSVSSFYLVMVVLFILLWGFSFLMQGLK